MAIDAAKSEILNHKIVKLENCLDFFQKANEAIMDKEPIMDRLALNAPTVSSVCNCTSENLDWLIGPYWCTTDIDIPNPKQKMS